MVHLTTSQQSDYYDTTCLFSEGEDENIRAGSSVVYAEARLVDAADVDEEVKQHSLKIRTIGPAAFQRILDGFRRNAPLYLRLIVAYEEARRQGAAD